jgi:hypothetical protein
MKTHWHIVGRKATLPIKAVLIALLALGAFSAVAFVIILVGLVLPVGFQLVGGAWMLIAALVLVLLFLTAMVDCLRSPDVTLFVVTVAAIPAVWMVIGNLWRLMR